MSTIQTGPRETLRRVGYVSEMKAAAPPPRRRSGRRHPERWMAHLGLLLVCVGFALPFVWMLSTSLKTVEKAMAFPPKFLPDEVRVTPVFGVPVPTNYV